jgi:hypothetical protein
MESKGSVVIKWALIGVLSFFGLIISIALLSDNKRVAEQQKTDQVEATAPAANNADLSSKKPAPVSTPNQEHIDFSKPIWVRAGAPVCTSMDELHILLSGKLYKDCIMAAKDTQVSVIESGGIMSNAWHIRVRAQDGDIIDAWVPAKGLRNGTKAEDSETRK